MCMSGGGGGGALSCKHTCVEMLCERGWGGGALSDVLCERVRGLLSCLHDLGQGRGRETISNTNTVITRMPPAFRWAVMRAISMLHK